MVEKTNKTIILSSHEVNLSIKFANNIVLFTDSEIYSGTSSELIEKKAFENLFPNEIVNFNRNLQQFIINKK